MGIHDRFDPFSKVIQITDLSSRSGVLESETSDDNSSVASVRQPPVKKRPRRTHYDLHSIASRLSGRTARRRMNHLSFAKSLVGLEEVDIEAERDSCPQSQSSFCQLFLEKKKMEAWNEFVEMTEEEQSSFISPRAVLYDEGSDDDELEDSPTSTPPSQDTRNVHPSYSSAECFQRVNSSIRLALKKKHLPLGMLGDLEILLRETFLDCPYAMYDSGMTTSFGRLLTHAVVQYLGLDVIYCGEEEDKSLTVVNRLNHFSPPSLLLIEYVRKK